MIKVRRMTKKKAIIILLILFIFLYSSTILYHLYKPLPKGISMEGTVYKVDERDITFLKDLTYQHNGYLKVEQEIYPRVFQIIEQADKFIVCDLFLFNGYYDHNLNFPPLSEEMADRLIRKKQEDPNIRIVVISDDINTSYGSHKAVDLEKLKKNGIEVVMTNLDPLRDSTPLYSGIWRIFFQWFGQSGKGWIPNALADTAPKMTIRSYLKLINIKANHRKTIVTDKTAIIASGNPHDASAYHSNTAFEVSGNIIGDILKSEQAAVNLSKGPELPEYQSKQTPSKGDVQVQLLTEGKVKKHLIKDINHLSVGDELWMGMFYVADRDVIRSLLNASSRGVKIKMILDPNENSFGHKKTGLPNRPVAQELHRKTKGNLKIKWYNTTDEQYHPKLMLLKKEKETILFNGSTNLTTRNLADFNLETDIKVVIPNKTKIVGEVNDYFQRLWNNEGGKYTLNYKSYETKRTFLQRGVYALQERLGITTY